MVKPKITNRGLEMLKRDAAKLAAEDQKDTDSTEHTFTPEEIERFNRYVFEDAKKRDQESTPTPKGIESTSDEADYLNNIVQVLEDLSEFLVDEKTNKLLFAAQIATEIDEDDIRELREFLSIVAKMQDFK